VDEAFGVEERTEGDLAYLAVRGELDLAAAPGLRERLYAAADQSSGPLVIDLLAVTFIDSTALGVLIGTQERCQERGIDLRLVLEDARILKIFEITGLTELFAISSTVAEAATR
jgi:anti-sigma B factor antagonist